MSIPSTPTARADRLARVTMSLAMPLSAVTGLVAAWALPALRTTMSAEITAIAAHRDRYYLYAICMLLSSYLLVPAILGVMALLRERASRWSALAGGLAVAGLLVAVGDAAVELMYWQMGAPGADHGQMVALAERYDNAPGSTLPYAVGGIVMLIGVLLLAVGLWRTRVVARWAAAALLLGTVANVEGFSFASRPVLIGSYVLLLVCFAPMARRLLRPDEAVPAAVPSAATPAPAGR